jgi:hypothetical protein
MRRSDATPLPHCHFAYFLNQFCCVHGLRTDVTPCCLVGQECLAKRRIRKKYKSNSLPDLPPQYEQTVDFGIVVSPKWCGKTCTTAFAKGELAAEPGNRQPLTF